MSGVCLSDDVISEDSPRDKGLAVESDTVIFAYTNACKSSFNVPFNFTRLQLNLDCANKFSLKSPASNFMKSYLATGDLLHADGQRDTW